MKCIYVCGTSRGKDGLEFNTCGRETKNTLYDVMSNSQVPICKGHAVFSLPLWEWAEHEKLIRNL